MSPQDGSDYADEHPFRCASQRDIGRTRDENQDACQTVPEIGLLVVSDGMGGHQGGELASRIVVRLMPDIVRQRLETLRKPRARAIRYWLKNDIVQLSKQLRKESVTRSDVSGMGATLVMALLRADRAHIASMGDSRAYLFRNGQLIQLTEDHSVVGLLLRNGDITPEQARTHAARGQLTRYIGMKDEVYPDVRTIELSEGDRLLLCSDGLTDTVPDSGIAEILMAQHDPQTTCQTLVHAANNAGGQDNIAVVVADYLFFEQH